MQCDDGGIDGGERTGTWWVCSLDVTVGKKKSLAAISENGRSKRMISLLVKICAFLFASVHLSSFLPYFQVHYQPEKILASLMSPNHERTYIMVKVRPRLNAARGCVHRYVAPW